MNNITNEKMQEFTAENDCFVKIGEYRFEVYDFEEGNEFIVYLDEEEVAPNFLYLYEFERDHLSNASDYLEFDENPFHITLKDIEKVDGVDIVINEKSFFEKLKRFEKVLEEACQDSFRDRQDFEEFEVYNLEEI